MNILKDSTFIMTMDRFQSLLFTYVPVNMIDVFFEIKKRATKITLSCSNMAGPR